MAYTVKIIHNPIEGKFETTCNKGAEEFGVLWLTANEAVVQTASRYTNVSNPAVKEVLVVTVLQMLRTLKARGYLK